MSPLVSIVLPTYNQARYLPAALDGIFSQTYRNWELIVVNDGSTDETPAVLAEYQRRYEFTLISQANGGLPNALNVGFARARGEYLTWTSSDNITKPAMLDVLVASLDAHPEMGLVYADWDVIDEAGHVVARAYSCEHDRPLLFMANYVNACFLYRRECAERVGLYDDHVRGGEDWDYWLRISKHYPLLHVPESLYEYRVHGESLTARSGQLVQEGRLVGYQGFSATWRRREPFVWWYGKVKWNVSKRLLGHPVGVHYQTL